MTTDDRSWLMNRIMAMDIKATFAYLYPRVFALVRKLRLVFCSFFYVCFQHTLEEDQIPPPMLRCLYERFSDQGAYLLGKILEILIFFFWKNFLSLDRKRFGYVHLAW